MTMGPLCTCTGTPQIIVYKIYSHSHMYTHTGYIAHTLLHQWIFVWLDHKEKYSPIMFSTGKTHCEVQNYSTHIKKAESKHFLKM